MAPNEEVVGSIPHAGVVLTTLVHPTMVGGPWTLVVWVPQSPLGGYHVRYLQGTSGQLGTSIVCHYSVHPRKGRVVLSQCPLVRWASGHWHYERTLYSRRPLAKKGPEFLSIYLILKRKVIPSRHSGP